MFVRHLYNPEKDNAHYYYHKGWNVQACLAYVIGIALPLPGFCGTMGAKVSLEAMRIGQLGWMLSFVTTFCAYMFICHLWPTKNQKIVAGLGLAWEQQRGD